MNPTVLLLFCWLIALSSAQVIPSSFDARTRWPNCPCIAQIPVQGCCDASYALVPAAILTDRACIRSNGTARTFSAMDAIACCTDCPFSQLRKCGGGDPVKVWNYIMTTGLASESCLPYALDPLCLGLICPLVCAQGSIKTVAADRVKAVQVREVPPDVASIQTEIYQNGPVAATVKGSSKNLTPGRAVRATQNNLPLSLGPQTVKIVGWGTENNQDYWLAISALGSLWGDLGTARIPRGVNYMGIESNVVVGTPTV